MVINYIYNAQGTIEYAVVPYIAWQKLEKLLAPEIEKENNNNNITPFDPKQYRGMLSHLNLDIENEIKTMRDEWTINI